MAVSKYFTNVDNEAEQELLQELVVEMIQIYGVDIVYIKRENLSIDPILREPTMSSFNESWEIEMYMPDQGGNGGQQNFMSKFGFRFDETTEIYCAISRWKELNTGLIKPREGDLIYVGNPIDPRGSFVNDCFQIKQCWLDEKGESPFGAHQTYRMTLVNFTKSYEEFNTNYEEINDVMNTNEDNEMLTAINKAAKDQATTLIKPKGNPFGDFSI